MPATTHTYISLDKLTRYDGKIKGVISAGNAATLASAQSYADGLATNYDAAGTAATAVSNLANGAVAANTAAIATLNGDAQTSGSVDYKVAQAVAGILNGADESFDTLKELADWISTHGADAAAMNTAITANTTNIGNLTTFVGSLPSTGTSATTVVGYVDEQVAAAKAYADNLAGDYATAAQGALADAAVRSVVEGSTNGTILVQTGSAAAVAVNVHGLGSAAFTESSAYDAAGTAATAVSNLANGAVATNTSDITTLKGQVEALEADVYVEATNAEIDALFPTT